jgi:hypothetical protein
MRLFKILMAVLAPLLLVGGIALAQGGSGIGWYEIPGDVRIGGQVAVTNASGVTTTDLTTSDDLTVGDDTTMTGDLAVGGKLSMDVDGPTTVTNDGSIDCSTGGLHLLTSAGSVGTATVVTTSTEGVLCFMLNEANQTITLTDTGVLQISGNAALGQHDVLCLMSANSIWYQCGKDAN